MTTLTLKRHQMRITIHTIEPHSRKTLARWAGATRLTPPAIPTWASLWSQK